MTPDADDVFDFGLPLGEAVDHRGLAFPPDGIRLLAEAAERLRASYRERVRGIKLVGSRARGDARRDSDWDLLVFLDACDFDVDLPKVRAIAEALEGRYGLGSVSISPLDREKFLGIEAKYPGIHERFRRDAVCL